MSVIQGVPPTASQKLLIKAGESLGPALSSQAILGGGGAINARVPPLKRLECGGHRRDRDGKGFPPSRWRKSRDASDLGLRGPRDRPHDDDRRLYWRGRSLDVSSEG